MSDYTYTPTVQTSTSVGGSHAIPFRDALDARRAGYAEFIQDGYGGDSILGTLQSRREGRMLADLSTKVNDRSYDRGVHKGERIDPGDYFWPSQLPADGGLRRQAMATPTADGTWASPRNAPMLTVQEQMTATGGTVLPMTPRGRIVPPKNTPYDTDAAQSQMLAAYLPAWR